MQDFTTAREKILYTKDEKTVSVALRDVADHVAGEFVSLVRVFRSAMRVVALTCMISLQSLNVMFWIATRTCTVRHPWNSYMETPQLSLTYVPFSPTVFPFLIGFSGIPEMFKSNTRAQTSTATRR